MTSCGWRASATRRRSENSRPCSVGGDHLLFVYGTLMRGFPLHPLLEGQAEYLGEAATPGLLFDLGRYPAALKSATGEIRGEIYRLLDPAFWRVLDSAEGSHDHGYPGPGIHRRPGRAMEHECRPRARGAGQGRGGPDGRARLFLGVRGVVEYPGRRAGGEAHLALLQEHAGRLLHLRRRGV